MDYRVLLKTMASQNATELHLQVGARPTFVIDGKLVQIKSDVVTREYIEEIVAKVFTEEQLKSYNAKGETMGGFGINEIGGFRVRAAHINGEPALVFRYIPE